MLKASHISKWFGAEGARNQVLKDISFEAREGEMLYIVGPSGSGKTTLLSIISGILRPDGGDVEINGHDIWTMNANALADFRLHSIGFVFQDFHLFPKLTCLENAAIPLILQKVDWDEALKRAGEALTIVGLADKVHMPPYQISIGQQQRVAVARAIAAQPEILILDEPTASLDGDTGKKIVSFIREKILNEKRLVIIVTHDPRIQEYATRIIKLEDGRLFADAAIR